MRKSAYSGDDGELRTKKNRPRRAFGKRPPAPTRKPKGKPGRPFVGAHGGGPINTWREFPCFHADLPGFGFAFLCATPSFFVARMGEKKNWAFFSPQTGFLAQNVFLCCGKNGVLRRVLRSPRGFLGLIFHARLGQKGEIPP